MTTPLESLARRAGADAFFLACPLHWFAQSQSMADEQLAEYLGCAREVLVKVRLCAAPASEQPAFQRDVASIAKTFGLDAGALAKAVRRGLVVLQMQSSGKASLAARDRVEEEEQ